MALVSGLMPAIYMLLRVPPLLIMDSILNQKFLFYLFPDMYKVNTSGEEDLWTLLKFTTWIFFSLFCFIVSVVVFLLSSRKLVYTYNFIISVGLIAISFIWNSSMLRNMDVLLNPAADITHYLRTFVLNVGVQCGLAYSFNSLRWEAPWLTYDFTPHFIFTLMKVDTYLAFLLPSLVKLLPVPSSLCDTSVYTASIPGMELALYLFTKLPVIRETLREGYSQFRVSIRTIGIQGLIESHWLRLSVPDVLRLFWIIRFCYQCVLFSAVILYDNHVQYGEYRFSYSDVESVVRALLVNGCDTMISLLGMTSILSYVIHYIGAGVAAFINLAEEENPNMGAVSATLFLLLAVQTGLTSLESDKRLERLYRNFCLLGTAVFHLIHSMVNPVLMTLSASHNDSVKKHGRVLVVCILLVILPTWLLVYLWSQHTTGTWMLAVTAFSIEVVVKVVVSLCQYCLFMMDSHREAFWEELDDYIYYIRSTGSTIEFLFGIFLFCNGGWILLFESGGLIRAIMMCIHAYYNIWVQAKDGWKTFKRRRTAVNKINSLPNADSCQLQRHNDVCAICYQELKAARITQCQHYFHGVCLRKWLYVQDRCPLCHEMISVLNSQLDGDTASIINDHDDDDNNFNDHLHQE